MADVGRSRRRDAATTAPDVTFVNIGGRCERRIPDPVRRGRALVGIVAGT